MDTEKLVKELCAEGDSLFKEAAGDGVSAENMRILVVKGQALKDSVKEKEKLIASLADTLVEMDKKLKEI